jgi:hypothetical protein
VPHDADGVIELRDAEGVGRPVAADLRRRAGGVGSAGLLDCDVRDGLALAERDLAERAGEASAEGEGDLLLDPERAVVLDLDLNAGVGEGEGLGARLTGREERRQGDRRDEGPAQNWTCGASRAGSSISKYGFSAKLNMPATMFVGTVSSAVS